MTLAFDANASRELDEAIDHHERERPGHGELLLLEVERVAARAQRLPRSAPRARELEPYDVRSFRLDRFPYALVVAELRGRQIVVAFAHEKREPAFWRDRLG